MLRERGLRAVAVEGFLQRGNDDAGEATLEILAQHGVRLLALRSAGYNHVDLRAAAAGTEWAQVLARPTLNAFLELGPAAWAGRFRTSTGIDS